MSAASVGPLPSLWLSSFMILVMMCRRSGESSEQAASCDARVAMRAEPTVVDTSSDCEASRLRLLQPALLVGRGLPSGPRRQRELPLAPSDFVRLPLLPVAELQVPSPSPSPSDPCLSCLPVPCPAARAARRFRLRMALLYLRTVGGEASFVKEASTVAMTTGGAPTDS